MKIVNAYTCLEKVHESFFFDEFLFLSEIVEQIAVLCILEYHINILLVFKRVVKLYNMRMIQFLMNFYFSVEMIGACVFSKYDLIDLAKGLI